MREEEDDIWMAAVATGDAEAFRRLFDKWKGRLMSFIYRSTASYPDAEDLTLKVFADLWQLAPRYEARGSFAAWLFFLARRSLQHHWRSARRGLPGATVGSPLPPEAVSGDNPLSLVQAEEALARALQQLPPNQREALLLTVHTDLAGVEAAAHLGISLTNFHVLVHRAKESLKKSMEAYFA